MKFLALLFCLSLHAATWDTDTITWSAPFEYQRAARAAFSEWGHASKLKFRRVESPTCLAMIEIVGEDMPDSAGTIAYALMTLNDSTGIDYVIIRVNTIYKFGCKGRFDLFTVLLHEIGHALGLGHTGDVKSIMHKDIYPMRRKHLSADDRRNIRELYSFLK